MKQLLHRNLKDDNFLAVKEIKPKIAKHNITVYKMFSVYNNIFYGPFTGYKFGQLKEGSIITPKRYKKILNDNKDITISFNSKKIPYDFKFQQEFEVEYNKEKNYYEIRSGWIHSYCCLHKALQYDKLIKEYNEELWECVIPKGSLYYEQEMFWYRKSHSDYPAFINMKDIEHAEVASQQLKLVKKIREA